MMVLYLKQENHRIASHLKKQRKRRRRLLRRMVMMTSLTILIREQLLEIHLKMISSLKEVTKMTSLLSMTMLVNRKQQGKRRKS
jgi:hypothetical protein